MNKTSLVKRLSYASSDTAGQLVFATVSFYILKFYTDVFGLAPATAGTILLVARMVDAVDAPVWGIIFDKTHSKWGKSRPWFLWLCVPYATFGVLTFLTPNLGYAAKVLYAGGTYILWSVLYTGINTPVTSILSALTPDPQERVTLTCYRMFGSKIGAAIVNFSALMLVAKLGGGDDRKGFMLTMPIFAMGTVLLYLFAFKNLVEVVKVEKKDISIRESFGAIRGNWPWIIIFFSSLFFWIAFIARISVAPYFFQYLLHKDEQFVGKANLLDFISLLTVLLLPWLCKVTSKRNAWLMGLAGMVIGQIIIYVGFNWAMSFWLVMSGWTIGYLASGLAMAMPFSILSDSVDYGEWKTGIRAAGFLTAIGAAFCLKAGAGIGSALPAWILGWCGYVAKQEQTPLAQAGIQTGFIWIPAFFLILSMIPVLFYGKYEKLEPEIHAELERRAAATR